ncbi:siderophore ABC transporter substrate-binding protein [Pectobacterium polonicum]|uniref:Siderophore ABC transporter substrate-binding protein n=1 Tax=Pectobacterium polonicum TaxID=2485124 RepID=A0AAE9NWI8_9GAMM|nr:siderophore ABC transporter substrate-binding protein [Pectobacterium polonicum]UVO10096.1 siderophore ABC transporter substrate-binding protein [Pectobacterium polonicum]GKW22821.1 iron ABC transporter substrate-binding protein [Pectobacterium carotovorum subsp. carotovorum]
MRFPSMIKMTLLASALVVAGCDQTDSAPTTSNTVTIEHTKGVTQVPVNPKKVIVFDTAILDTLTALNIDIAGVPQGDAKIFPDVLAQYKDSKYLNAGTLFEPNYEAISSAAPDLIIGGGRARDAYDKLNAIAPTIALDIDDRQFMTSFTQRVEQLGEIFSKQDEAKAKLDDFKQRIAQTHEKADKAGTALLVMVTGGKMSAYGPKSRFGFVFDELGFKPATEFPDSGRHGNVVTSELLLSANPDWLFVFDRDSAIGNQKEGQSAKQVLDNPLVNKTNAWQNNRVIYLDSSSIYIAGGLQSYLRLIDDVNKALDAKP